MSELPRFIFPESDESSQYSQSLVQALRESPIPEQDLAANLGLYLPGYSVRRILWLYELYQKILTVPGYVFDLGTRYGQNLVLFRQFHEILEPGNATRAFFGFDTFTGLTPPAEQDGTAACANEGVYATPENYEEHLQKVISIHEGRLDTKGQIQRAFTVPGDASVTLEQFLEENPHALCALVYFDFDIYQPTKRCLELLKPRLGKGSIIAFDELVVTEFPGETVALMETLDLKSYQLKRTSWSHCWSFLVC